MSNIVVSLWLGLLRLILTFLHLVYSGLQYFDMVWTLKKRKLDSIMQGSFAETEPYVSRFVTSLNKCPSHFAVILGTENLDVEDFSNIVLWCLAAGISFVSFYDHSGHMKDNESTYFKFLIDKRKIDPKRIIFGSKVPTIKNGYSPKVHVSILTLVDGKPLFVKCVENISKKVLLDEVQPAKINEDVINNELQQMTGYPDPDLAVVCGSVLGTFGFLPWQIKVTEFLQTDSLSGMKVSEFTTMLQKYSKCHQRFGK